MKRMQMATALSCLLLSLGCQAGKTVEAVDSSKEIATVNGEVLDEGDFERSQAWMPAFARQLESNTTIDISRFWGLVQMMLMAQDAQDKGLLSPAERSLSIKEALAKRNIENLPYPNYAIEDAEIDAWLKSHPDALKEPAQFTVNYALIKNEEKIPALLAAYGLASGAQMGYNLMDPPELPITKRTLGSRLSNIEGHSMSANKFNYVFASNARENRDEYALLGPFTSEDKLIFSCPEAIKALKEAELGRPMNRSIACSGEWKSFVILDWRQDEGRVTDERARQLAIENLTTQKRAEFRDAYIADKLARMAKP